MSAVKELNIKLIPTSIAKDIIIKNHYSKRWPNRNTINYGVFYQGRLLGACTFGNANSPAMIHLVEGTEQHEYLELTRLWLSDELPKNSESRVVSYCLRHIKKHCPEIKWIVSFADENEEHKGTIYQATNWTYTGIGGTNPEWINPETGKKYNNRTLSDYKVSTEDLEELGMQKHAAKGKHRYIYWLQPSQKQYLTKEILPYPKSQSSAQTDEG